MTTISIVLPETLLSDIQTEAERRQLSDNEIILQRLEKQAVDTRPTLWERMKDLVIDSDDLPADLATNPKYMEGYGR
jgi:hypothetical protein